METAWVVAVVCCLALVGVVILVVAGTILASTQRPDAPHRPPSVLSSASASNYAPRKLRIVKHAFNRHIAAQKQAGTDRTQLAPAKPGQTDSAVVGGDVTQWVWGSSKARRVLPYSSANDDACAESYECAPRAREQRLSSAKRKALNWVGGGVAPCDASIVAPPTPFFQPQRKRFYFGIGINYLSQPQNRLTSCWNDVDALHREFSNRFGGFTQSWILTDRPSSGFSDIPHAATVKKTWGNVMDVVSTHAKAADAVDLVFVYSGHGTFRLTTDPGELGGQSDAIVLLDRLIYDYEVMAQFVRPLNSNVNLLIVFDSCNSGSAANLPWTFNPLSGTVNQTSLHTDLTNNVIMISGCRDEQTSAAGATANDLSECSRVLIAALREHPQAGTLAVTDLVQTMRAKLVAAQDTQIPQLSLSRPHLLSSLI